MFKNNNERIEYLVEQKSDPNIKSELLNLMLNWMKIMWIDFVKKKNNTN